MAFNFTYNQMFRMYGKFVFYFKNVSYFRRISGMFEGDFKIFLQITLINELSKTLLKTKKSPEHSPGEFDMCIE